MSATTANKLNLLNRDKTRIMDELCESHKEVILEGPTLDLGDKGDYDFPKRYAEAVDEIKQKAQELKCVTDIKWKLNGIEMAQSWIVGRV